MGWPTSYWQKQSTFPYIDAVEARLSFAATWDWETTPGKDPAELMAEAAWHVIAEKLVGRRFHLHPQRVGVLFGAGRFSGVPVMFTTDGSPIPGLHLEATANLKGWRAFFPPHCHEVEVIKAALETETVPT